MYRPNTMTTMPPTRRDNPHMLRKQSPDGTDSHAHHDEYERKSEYEKRPIVQQRFAL